MNSYLFRFLDRRLALAAAAFLLLSYVVTGGAQVEKPDLNSIKQITIDSEIPQPEIPFIQGAGNFKAFAIGGGIGGAIEQNEAGKVFREYMRRNNIDISRIVFESFKRVVLEDKILALADNSDTRLKLAI